VSGVQLGGRESDLTDYSRVWFGHPRTRSTLSDLEPESKAAREAWDMAIQARDEVSTLARSSH
jgi:hypothetical protein